MSACHKHHLDAKGVRKQSSRYIRNHRRMWAGSAAAAVFVCCSRVCGALWEILQIPHTRTHSHKLSHMRSIQRLTMMMMMYGLDVLRSFLSSTRCQGSAVTQADTAGFVGAKKTTICFLCMKDRSSAGARLPLTRRTLLLFNVVYLLLDVEHLQVRVFVSSSSHSSKQVPNHSFFFMHAALNKLKGTFGSSDVFYKIFS